MPNLRMILLYSLFICSLLVVATGKTSFDVFAKANAETKPLQITTFYTQY